MRQLSSRWHSTWGWPALAALAGLLLLFPGCTTEEIIVVDPPLFDDIPAEANGYVGYRSSEALDQGRTVCGECHASKQTAWVTTAHADAWNGLQESGHAQAFCEGCHTVNQLGNPDVSEGGWLTTSDERYYDVQCESCHGPGETHA
ncbi:MAG: hypothetical protein JSV95_12655, partial [Gemmatimonadota bacterium]